MSRKEIVKAIRAELKTKGINARQVSVTSKDSLYDEVINATIKDLKVPFNTVKEVVEQYSHVRYDEHSMEILAGCNVYTHVQFDYDAVSTEREKYMSLAQEIIEKYKDVPEGQLEVLARKGDLEILYLPNAHYNNGKVIEVCKITKQEYQSWTTGEYYFSTSINNVERYNAHNDYAMAEAMVYITNQYGIDFFAPVEPLDESVLEVHCISQEEKERNARAEEDSKRDQELAKQVKNIQPVKVDEVREKNIRVKAKFPSLNKQNTIEEYREELERDYNTNTVLVCEVVTLSNSDYELFTNNFLCDCDFIAGKGGNGSDFETDKESFLELTEDERKQYINQSYTLGVLVQSEDGQQIIVDCQGYNYARYVGFLQVPFGTPEPPKPTKKTNNDKIEISASVDNVVSLAAYRDIKTQVTAQAETKDIKINNKQNEELATKKQLWALYCVTKINTTNLTISKNKASELIGKSKAGQDIKQELITFIRSQGEQLMAR
jgi:ribosomal protein S17E